MKKFLKWIAVACVSAAVVPAFAAPNCSAEVESNDAMQFNTKTISVPAACKDFTVKLKHVGKMPKTAMGHNLVVSKTSDMQGIANDGIPAGPDKDYLKPADARVIAHTKLIGGGESASVTFAVSKLKAGDDYTFFCSFPGHSGIMKGALTLAK
ncbi:azurin [Diaphorobacter sp. HDW4A]|uniref:azurin n=1 Tax=Diaphorobacter sp. HDW4A TaxID=2714924 RepID=UPI00140DA8D1|nr:azurin [Diaphorobacter sp. HDW4A]QIL80560.1 azurin [Diaphorobacter sp. HDW4A]